MRFSSGSVPFLGRIFCFSFLALIVFTSPALAIYECPKPNTPDRKRNRCTYIEEALGIFDGYNKNEDDTMAKPPNKKDFDTIQEIISVVGPIVADCLYGYQNQPKPRLYNCGKKETQGTGCIGPSKRLNQLYMIYNQKVAQCKALRPNRVQRCLERLEDKYFDKFRDAYSALANSANARRAALKKEYKNNCNNNNGGGGQCPAPALAAISAQLLKTKALNNSCPSFAKHGFVNGIFGTNPECTMPAQTCQPPQPPPDDSDDSGDDDNSDSEDDSPPDNPPSPDGEQGESGS